MSAGLVNSGPSPPPDLSSPHAISVQVHREGKGRRSMAAPQTSAPPSGTHAQGSAPNTCSPPAGHTCPLGHLWLLTRGSHALRSASLTSEPSWSPGFRSKAAAATVSPLPASDPLTASLCLRGCEYESARTFHQDACVLCTRGLNKHAGHGLRRQLPSQGLSPQLPEVAFPK